MNFGSRSIARGAKVGNLVPAGLRRIFRAGAGSPDRVRLPHRIARDVGGSAAPAWHVVLKGSGTAPAGGRVSLTVFSTSKAFIGLNQRVHFSVGKDASVLAGTSAWKPFRITNSAGE